MLAPFDDEAELELLDEPGALDKRVDTMLSASEVSPDCKSPLISDKALERGF